MSPLEIDPKRPSRSKRFVKNQATQTVSANLIFPLLLVIPGVREWVSLNPEAYVSIQGLLNVIVNFIREKVR